MKQNRINIYIYLIVLILAGTFLSSCKSESPVSPTGTNSKIEGVVTNGEGLGKSASVFSPVEGAVVSVIRIKADGSFETVSDKEATTNAEGRFVIETKVDGESHLVVRAVKGSKTWKAVVSSTVRTGITVYCQPLNDETTAEAEVYQEAMEDDDEEISYGEISSYVNAELSAKIIGNKNLLKKTASSIKEAIKVQYKSIVKGSVEFSQARWNALVIQRAEAQASLERDLWYSVTEAQVNTAFESYNQKIVNAFIEAGLSAEIYSKSLEVSSRSFIKNMSGLGNDIAFSVVKRVSWIKSRAYNYSLQAKFRAINATEAQINAIITAYANLSASIEASSTTEEIINAFETYHTEIITQLRLSLGVHGILLAAIESNINNFKLSLQGRISGQISTDELVDAYFEFYGNIKNEVKNKLQDLGDSYSDSSAEILISISSHF